MLLYYHVLNITCGFCAVVKRVGKHKLKQHIIIGESKLCLFGIEQYCDSHPGNLKFLDHLSLQPLFPMMPMFHCGASYTSQANDMAFVFLWFRHVSRESRAMKAGTSTARDNTSTIGTASTNA